jgi:hypothetical protein
MSALQQVKYRTDYIKAFELTEALLPQTVRRDTQDRGGSMVFLVSGSGGRTAVTRGPRGLIPPSDNVQSQITLTFKEAHDKVIMTNFNIFTAQGDQLAMMKDQSLGVIHREQDLEIVDALNTGTVTMGTIASMEMDTVLRIITTLAQQKVGINAPGNLFGVITPAVYASMIANIDQFTNSDYTALKKVDKGIGNPGTRQYFGGVEWIVNPDLPGAGTATATNFVYHRDAIGYAVSTRGIDPYVGYNEEEDYSVRRTSIYHGAVKLQNAGVIKFVHDDTPMQIT